jgi:3-oxoacyl-[acyl-carrier protein] reductase
MTASDWDAVLGAYLRGAFLMSRATQRSMSERGWDRIVNLQYLGAAQPGSGEHSAAQAGMQGRTKTLAVELRRRREAPGLRRQSV